MSNIGGRIAKLREKAGLTQEQLSKMIGVKRITLSKIENNERKLHSDDLVKLSEIFNMTIDQLINSDNEPEINILREKKKMKDKPKLRINIPQKNLEKCKQVLLYILNKVGSKPNIGETVIYKLLYFVDFNYYEKYEEQLIGAEYIKNHYGPTPIEFKKVIEQMIIDNEIVKVKSEHFNYPQTKYLPLIRPDLSVLTGRELEMINSVLNKLSDMNATEISDYSHNDVPWLTANKGERIEYESVFYRTPDYSVREDNE